MAGEGERSRLSVESKDKLVVSAETVSGSEIIDMVYQGEPMPQDERFGSGRDNGVFRYFDIGKVLRRREKLFYPLVREGEVVVGLAELEESPYRENTYWISFMSIDPKFQEKGYSKRLVEETMRFAKERGIIVQRSTYTEQGEERLKHNLEGMAEEAGVELVD